MALGEMAQGLGQIRDQRQLGLGLEALQQDPGAVRPEGMRPEIWNEAQQRYGAAAEARLRATNAQFEEQVQQTMQTMLGEAERNGDVVSYLGAVVPKTREQMHAANRLYRLADQQTGLRRNVFEQRLAMGARQGQQLMESVRQARSMVDSGKADQAGRLLEGASNQALTRWRYRYNSDTGKLDRLHLSRDEGWVETGDSLDVSSALQQAENMTIRDFALGVAQEMAATSEFNRREIEQGGRAAQDGQGNSYVVYPQINLQGFGGRDYLVFDDKNKLVGRFDEDSFPRSGLRLSPAGAGTEGAVERDWGDIGLQWQKIYNDSLKAQLGDTMVASPEERAQAEAMARQNADQWLSLAVGHGMTMEKLQRSRQGGLPGYTRPEAGAAPARGGQTAVQGGPPVELKPGETVTVRNSETGEEQTWTMDRHTGVPLLLRRGAASGRSAGPDQSAPSGKQEEPGDTGASLQRPDSTPEELEQKYARYRGTGTVDKHGNIWVRHPDGQLFRLMRYEPMTKRYGSREYPNRKRPEYEAALRALGLMPRQ
jgi:hypothetical protein